MSQARAVTARVQEEMFGDAVPTKASASTSYAPDVSAAETHVVTLTGATTIAAPTGTAQMQPGTRFALVVVQDTTGGRALSWASNWRNAPSGLGGSAAANTRALFEFRFDGVNMQYVGGSTAFA